MRFSVIAAAAALAAGANAYSNATYVTEVVTAYTTYCPEPTKITHGGKTYTITSATTLTITDCPGGCTVTKPVAPTSTSVAPIYTPPAGKPETPVVPVVPGPSGVPAPYPNGTVPVVPSAPAGTGSPTGTAPPAFTGAANRAFAASGAGLAAVFGVVAYVL